MSTEVCNETSYTIDAAEFSQLATFVLQQLHVNPQAELSILFYEPQPMEELHVKWMDLEGPTDVMSFPMDELRPGSAGNPTEAGILGDIVICPAVAAHQAKVAGHSTVEEMLLLTVHGILHLLGFDHGTEDEEKEMFALQRKLLLTFLAQRAEGSTQEASVKDDDSDLRGQSSQRGRMNSKGNVEAIAKKIGEIHPTTSGDPHTGF